jgi:hypothetical protein
VRVALGDLSEAEHVDVIVRLHANARRAGATVELMDANLSFKDAVAEAGPLERHVFLGAHATEDAAQLEHGRNPAVERDAARMMAAVVTVEAIQRAREGDIDQARQILDEAAQRASSAGAADPAVTEQVAEMRVLGSALPSIVEAEAPAASPPRSGEPPPATVIRRAHDRAMNAMQPASN